MAASIISVSDGSMVVLRNMLYFMSVGSKRPRRGGVGDSLSACTCPSGCQVPAHRMFVTH